MNQQDQHEEQSPNQNPNGMGQPFPLFELLELLARGGMTQSMNMGGIQVRVIHVDMGDISFGQPEAEAQKDDLPPLRFVNDKYNVALQVSHTLFKKEYEPFQKRLENAASSYDSNALDYIKTEKPAAICVEKIPNSSYYSNDNLIEAPNFVSDEGNVIMPSCQLHKALHYGHLFNATTGELLTTDECRKFERACEADLQQQQPVQKGLLYVRSVPQFIKQ